MEPRPPDITPDDERLAALLRTLGGRSSGLASLREESGDLFEELSGIVETEDLLRAAVAPDDEGGELPRDFGPYRLLGKVGSGASGIVFKALGADGVRTVAVKVMREGFAASEESLARFRQEAEIASGLDDPRFIRFLDVGEVDGRMYLAMEYLPGASLADVMQEVKRLGQPQPTSDWLALLDAHGVPKAAGDSPAESWARRIAGVLAPVASALAVLGTKGFVHRDIKPGNLVLDGRGALRITDFGVAKALGRGLTPTVAILGTPAYMSPEQASGGSRDVTASADIYALGATLYECLVLRGPAEGNSYGEIFAAVIHGTPRPVGDVYPRGIATLVDRCLQKQPQDRYRDAETLAKDLDRFARSGTVGIGPVPVGRRIVRYAERNRPVVAGVVATAVLVATAALFTWFTRPARLSVTSAPVAARLTLDGEDVGRTPWNGKIARGAHTVVAHLDRFVPAEEAIDLDAGQAKPLIFMLVPADPDDQEALRLFAEAHGLALRLPGEKPPRARYLPPASDAPWFAHLELLTPRGIVAGGGLLAMLHSGRAVEGVTLRVVRPEDGSVAHEAAVPAREGDVSIDLPGLAPGRYRIDLVRGDESAPAPPIFSVTESAPALLPDSIRDDPSSRNVVAARLLEERRDAEAFLLTFRQNGRVARRLALEALLRMGLDDTEAYSDLRKGLE